MATIQADISNKLTETFSPEYIEVINESHMHSVPPNSETHFKVVLVSEQFEAMTKVKRHQTIYTLLANELAGPVHALALHLYNPQEWQRVSVPDSPVCANKR